MFGSFSDDTLKRPGLCNFMLHEKTFVTSKYVIKSVNIIDIYLSGLLAVILFD